MTKKTLTKKTLEERFYSGEFDTEYAEFIMARADGDKVICNGDTLTDAMESCYLADEFLAHLESIE